MTAHHVATISFLVGAAVSGGAFYVFNSNKPEFSDNDIAMINQRVSESGFPALSRTKVQAMQAIAFYENRKDDKKTDFLCSSAISDFLTTIEVTLQRGDMYFMADDILRDKGEILKFLEANPQLKLTNSETDE